MSARFFAVTLALCAGLTLLAQGARIKSQEALSRTAKQAASGSLGVAKKANCVDYENEKTKNPDLYQRCFAFKRCEQLYLDAIAKGTTRSAHDVCCKSQESCGSEGQVTPGCTKFCVHQMRNVQKADEDLGQAIAEFEQSDKLTSAVEALRTAIAAATDLDASNGKMKEANRLLMIEENKARQKLSEAIRKPEQVNLEDAISNGAAVGLPKEELQKFQKISDARAAFVSACGPDALTNALAKFPDFSIKEGATFGQDYETKFAEALEILAQEEEKVVAARLQLTEAVNANGDADQLGKVRKAIVAGRQAGLSEQELDDAEALAKKLADEAEAKLKAEQEEDARLAAAADARNAAPEEEETKVAAENARNKVAEEAPAETEVAQAIREGTIFAMDKDGIVKFSETDRVHGCNKKCKAHIELHCRESKERKDAMKKEGLCVTACHHTEKNHFQFTGCAGRAQ